MKTKLLRKLRKRARRYVMVVQLRNGRYRIKFNGGDLHPISSGKLGDCIAVVDKLRIEKMELWVRYMKKETRYVKRIVY